MSTTKIIEEKFTVPFKNLRFHFGGVSCKKQIRELDKAVSITIINYDIREEFEVVKTYFANALGTPTVQITVRIEAVDGVPRKIEAQSPEIAGINQSLIETVRLHWVKDTVKKKVKIETEQTILGVDEMFTLADDLIRITDTKHYHHLQYLAGRHAHEVMRLRFVLKPFSFLFLLEGTEHYHVVWETLDTEEATYVWPVAKDLTLLKLALKKIEETIQLVKSQGKAAYISAAGETYRRIFHRYKEGVKGFVKWKGELESGLA
jgi:hypothetical protein